MSSFKLQEVNEGHFPIKNQPIPASCSLISNIKAIKLLNYEISTLLSIIEMYFDEDSPSINLLSKALQIIGMSLNDKELISNIQAIIAKNMHKGECIYTLFCYWARAIEGISSVIAKFSPKIRQKIVSKLFEVYLTSNYACENALRKQLPLIFQLIDSKKILEQTKDSFLKGSPLLNTLNKCMKINSNKIQFNRFINLFMQYIIPNNEAQFFQIIKVYQKQKTLISYLFTRLPNLSSLFIKLIKNILDQNNIFSLQHSDKKINVLLKSAVKEWINADTNFWKVLQKHYFQSEIRQRQKIFALDKDLNHQNQFSELLSVCYLYRFFKNDRFEFDKEDDIFKHKNNEHYTDIYRAITHCKTFKFFSLIIVNTNSAPKAWKKVDPFKTESSNRSLRKFITKHQDFYQEIEKKYLQKNKKLELCFHTFVVNLKQNNVQITVTYDQLRKLIQSDGILEKQQFQNEYVPYESKLKVEAVIKKQHNIIIEARLVKILKKHKERMSVTQLIKQSNYENEVVEACLKRLVMKGLAEQNQKQGSFIYLP